MTLVPCLQVLLRQLATCASGCDGASPCVLTAPESPYDCDIALLFMSLCPSLLGFGLDLLLSPPLRILNMTAGLQHVRIGLCGAANSLCCIQPAPRAAMVLSAASSGVLGAVALADVTMQRRRLQQWPGIQWKLAAGDGTMCPEARVSPLDLLLHSAALLCSDKIHRCLTSCAKDREWRAQADVKVGSRVAAALLTTWKCSSTPISACARIGSATTSTGPCDMLGML